jgi:hypothetical protein
MVIAPGGFVLTGRVEKVVSLGSSQVNRAINGTTYGAASSGLGVTLSLNLADKNGRIIFGAPILTEIETSYAGASRDTVNTSQSSGEALYTLLQQKMALTAARKIAFHLRPLLVTQGGARRIQLNYGSPLLDVGAMLSITSPDGSSSANYRVTSAGYGTAIAQQLGDADSSGIVPGSRGLMLDRGDPGATRGFLERVELP